ncbi:MAG: hypothetical protein QNJ00_02355 [Woeseiaceae bacterium]|nr:hypothetical protein [Woeseiaceae bacterium]
MSLVTASAPGKVVLAGEYAVLDGAPAIAMAVNRRAIARYTPGPFSITCEGVVEGSDRTLFDAVLSGLSLDIEAGEFTLDTRGFTDPVSGAKLGIGSSAALSVALNLLLGRIGDKEAEAHAAHRAFQQGAGSGIDVAVSTTGGLIEFRREGYRVSPIDWPEGLQYRLLWSGVPSSTRDKLAKLDAGGPSRDRLADAAASVAAAWRSGEAAAVVAGTRDYVAALEAFDADYRIGIFEAGHAELVAAAPETLAYKSCGAGGGDLGIALGTDRDALDAFVDVAREHGFASLDLRVDRHGAAISGAAA